MKYKGLILITSGAMALSAGNHLALAAFQLPNDAINAPDSWTRGGANTTYAEWANFESAYLGVNDTADTSPPASEGVYNPKGTPTVQQLNAPTGGPPGSIFLSGSGWIYGFGDPLSVSVNVPNYNLGAPYQTDVILQVKLLAPVEQPLLLDTVELDGVAYDSVQELSRVVGTDMGFTSYNIEYWFKWDDVPGNAASNALTFQTYTEDPAVIGEHTFLQRVAVDTNTVPEPASAASIGAAIATLMLRRRRNRD